MSHVKKKGDEVVQHRLLSGPGRNTTHDVKLIVPWVFSYMGHFSKVCGSNYMAQNLKHKQRAREKREPTHPALFFLGILPSVGSLPICRAQLFSQRSPWKFGSVAAARLPLDTGDGFDRRKAKERGTTLTSPTEGRFFFCVRRRW